MKICGIAAGEERAAETVKTGGTFIIAGDSEAVKEFTEINVALGGAGFSDER